jgi:hypothetical protein
MNGQNRRWFDIAMLAVAVCATVAVAVGLEGPLRSVVVFAALILVPGAAVVPYLQIRDLSQFLGLTIAFSLGVGVIGAMILASLGWWHPVVLGALVVVASCVSLGWDIRHIAKSAVEVGA